MLIETEAASAACGEPGRYRPDAPASTRVILADRAMLVRAGIKALIEKVKGVEVIAEASSGAELIGLVEALKTDLVILDIDMPDMDGIAVISQLRASRPYVKIMVLTARTESDTVRRATESGACAFVAKDDSLSGLDHPIESVKRYGKYYGPSIAPRLLQPAAPGPQDLLTPRQIEVLKFIALGKASKEIGFKLGLSPKTVDVHRGRIMQRLGIMDVAGLTRYAIRHRMIEA